MKVLKIFILMIASLILANTVSALAIFAEWQNNQSIITINQDDQVYYDYTLFSMNPPIQYDIKLYNNYYNLIKTFVDTTSNENIVSKRAYINKNDYISPGSYTLTVSGKDSLNDARSTTLTLIVKPKQVNHAPILTPIIPQVINEGELLSFNVYSVDPDNDHVTLTAENLPQGSGFIDNNDNSATFTWQTNYNDQGAYNVNFIASDGSLSNEESVFILINNVEVNHNPKIKILNPKEEDIIFGNYNIKWDANDQDQSKESLDIKLEYRQITNNIFKNFIRIFSDDWVVLEDGQNNNDGTSTWDTTKVINGNYELKATVEDDTFLTGEDLISSFTIDNIIIGINHNPIIISSPITTALVNKLYSYDVDATDQDNDHLTYKLISFPEGISINKETGLITWMPSKIGTYNVEVIVEDGKGGSDEQSFSILVSQENPIPNPTIIIHHFHNLKINNVILNHDNNLNIYAYLRNEGNRNERINVRATIMENGMQAITALNIDKNDNKYASLSFSNIQKGYYIVKVEAFNSNNYEVKYAYITI